MRRRDIRKRVIFSVLAIALLQKEIAVAANAVAQSADAKAPSLMNAPLPELTITDAPGLRTMTDLQNAEREKDAAAIIKVADSRKLSDYLGAPSSTVSSEELGRFEQDLQRLLLANKIVGIVDDPKGFNKWWPGKRANLLLTRQLMGENVSLQLFLVQVYTAFKRDMAENAKDPAIFIRWLEMVITNPIVRTVSETTYNLVANIFSFVSGIVWGALIAGPLGGMMTAFVEGIIRPLREKLGVLGNRIFAKPGVALNSMLFDQGAVGDAKEALNAAKEAANQMRELARSLGYEMTAQQYTENVNRIQEAWNLANQLWLKTQPASYQMGRNVLTDAMFFRPIQFSVSTLQGVQTAELHKQAIEATVDRIRAQSPSPQLVEKVADTLCEQLKEEMANEKVNPKASEAARANVNEAMESLEKLGASSKQIERIVQAQKNLLMGARHAAASLAAQVFHDFEFSEYNRIMPETIYKGYMVMRESFALDFFHREYARAVVDILELLEFKIEVASKTLQEASQSKRALRVLEKINSSPENSRAVERSGELGSKPQEADPKSERGVLKEAVGRFKK